MKTTLKKIILLVLVFFGTLSVGFAAQCLGTTRAGKQCRNQGGSSGYCHYHNPTVKHCAGTTKDGSACRNLPQAGSAYCRVHKK